MSTSGALPSRFHRAAALALGLVIAVLVAPVAWAGLLDDGIASTAIGRAVQPNPLLSVDQNRTTVVDRIVADWGDALARSAAGLGKAQLRTLLAGLRSDHLLAASLAGSLDGLRNVIDNALTTTAPVGAGSIRSKSASDSASLTYTPVVPCRIVDSRNAGGAFGAGETRHYLAHVTSGSFAPQGGAASNCGIPANPGAVALNVTIVSAGGVGFLTAWPYNASQPLASTLTYFASGELVSNGTLIPICQPACTADFSVYVSGNVDVIIDIVGYFEQPNKNVLMVTTSGGLFNSVTAALNSITDNSATNRYLILVGPGTFTEAVTMKPYVDIQGSGELTTTIVYSDFNNTATLAGASNAELRSLSVLRGGDCHYTPEAVAIHNDGTSPRLTQVTANAGGGLGGAIGISNINGASPTMTHVTISASDGCPSGSGTGVRNIASSPTMTNVTATGTGPAGTGISNSSSSSPVMTNVTATGAGYFFAVGMSNNASSPTIRGSTIVGTGGGNSYGITNSAGSGAHTVTISNSQVTGATNTIQNNAFFTTRIGASQLGGGPVTGGGTITCAGVYDEAFVFFASTCP
jgi:hypothetical protein